MIATSCDRLVSSLLLVTMIPAKVATSFNTHISGSPPLSFQLQLGTTSSSRSSSPSSITTIASTFPTQGGMLWMATNQDTADGKDNRAMAFLKKIGKVGGTANKDFRFAIGIDEGPAGKTTQDPNKIIRKRNEAYRSCTDTGIIDDLSEPFPLTSSGTQWNGFTDRVMGGLSMGTLSREYFVGRAANVLRGHVSLENNGGFIQMATDLANLNKQGDGTVDASNYDGIELEVCCHSTNDLEKFNIHLKTDSCPRPFSSYRASFEAVRDRWSTIRVPFSKFRGHGPGASENPFNTSALKRAGIVAIGRQMDVVLGVATVRFYKNV